MNEELYQHIFKDVSNRLMEVFILLAGRGAFVSSL
jgi:hypothetical protein